MNYEIYFCPSHVQCFDLFDVLSNCSVALCLFILDAIKTKHSRTIEQKERKIACMHETDIYQSIGSLTDPVMIENLF